MSCKLGTDCVGPLWTCRSCGSQFCLDHSHVTGLGTNVECIECENARLENKDADFNRPQAAEKDLAALDRSDQHESRGDR